jgi:hypothetical protein
MLTDGVEPMPWRCTVRSNGATGAVTPGETTPAAGKGDDMRRRWLTIGLVIVAVMTTAATCQNIPSSDSGTPTVYMLVWKDDGTGHEGAQDTIQPGGTVSRSISFLGPNKADFRIYGKEDPGIITLTVTGSAHGHCQAGFQGAIYTADFTTSLPTQVEKAPSGKVISSLTVHLDSFLASCGSHVTSTSAGSQTLDYSYLTATWNVHAEADNCCGGKGQGDFTIVLS